MTFKIRSRAALVVGMLALASCGHDRTGGAADARTDASSGSGSDAGVDAANTGPDATASADAGLDAAADAANAGPDAAASVDASADAAPDATPDAAPDAMTGIITGGPCLSGAPGATAYRVRWANGGGTAYPVYEVNGLPDTSRDHVGAYGYQIGFTPSYVDTFLAQGGLQLNSSSFVDIELSTVGVSQITTATLSIYGRSYNTTASGSFDWQTFSGIGAAPTNLVSNSAPYEWYRADMTTEIDAGDDGILLRIKAGPASGSLVVNRIEICVQAI